MPGIAPITGIQNVSTNSDQYCKTRTLNITYHQAQLEPRKSVLWSHWILLDVIAQDKPAKVIADSNLLAG